MSVHHEQAGLDHTVLNERGVRVAVCPPSEVPLADTASDWQFPGVALTPARVLRSARDRRWRTMWAVARRHGEVVGVLPIYLESLAATPAPFDPRLVAPSLFADFGSAAGWAFVGGYRDFVSGVLLGGRLSEDDARLIRRALVGAAFAYAVEQGRVPVALFVQDRDLADFQAALHPFARVAEVKQAAVVDLPEGGGHAEFVAGLPKKIRYRVRKEAVDLAQSGLAADRLRPDEVMSDAVPLLLDTKLRHGLPDHLMLATSRYREWTASGAEEQLALGLRDPQGRLCGVSLLARHGRCVEVHELGLATDHPERHLAYVELLFHAPLRYALEHGCHRMVLGVDSAEPKVNRGARLEPVWALTIAAGS